ncbi:O-antigen ligase family protein [Bacteroidota bacterium]|nr:O-antigen ligase family protein [Bacteroidota bacterium]
MKKYIQFFLASLPLIISFKTSDPVLSIRYVYLSIFILGFFLFKAYKKVSINFLLIKNPIIILILVIIFFSTISSLINGVGAESIFSLARLISILLLTILFTNYFLENNYEIVIKPIVIFSFLISLIYLFQFIVNYERIMLIDIYWKRNLEFDKIASTMANKNLLSSILFLTMPFNIILLKKEKIIWKLVSIFSIFLFFAILLQTQTKAVMIAILLSTASYFFINRNSIRLKHILIFISALLISYLFIKKTNRIDKLYNEISSLKNYESSDRFKLYKRTIKLISDNLLIGVGPGNWKIDIWKYGLYNNGNSKIIAQRPHNDILWITSENGIVGGLSYLLIFIILIKYAYDIYIQNRSKKIFAFIFSGLIGYLFISLVDFPIERVTHNVFFCLIASILVSSKLKYLHDSYEKKIFSKIFFMVVLTLTIFTVIVSVFRYVGDASIQKAIYFKSKKDWKKVIKYSKKSNNTFYNMDNKSIPVKWYAGIAYYNLKKYNSALKYFQDSYKINPYNTSVMNNYATTLEVIGNSNKAKGIYNEIFEIDSTFKDARINFSAILYNEKNYNEAFKSIIKSNVEPYWIREDNDIYDIYLRNIIHAWYFQEKNNLKTEERKKVERLLIRYEKNPKRMSDKICSNFKKKNNSEFNLNDFIINFE